MPNENPPACGSCSGPEPPGSVAGACYGVCSREVFSGGLLKRNPISTQILGVCSALAVTNRLENALVMGAALTFVAAMSSLLVSLMRRAIPRRIRMIVEVAVIATFVIVFDQMLKAFYWEMSGQLGPYVGLIITNCIVMGRAEAFALHNPPLVSVADGVANGLGYAAVLGIIGFFRELLGTGKILVFEKLVGVPLDISGHYTSNQLMVLAPGAFIVMGLLVAALRPAGGARDEVGP